MHAGMKKLLSAEETRLFTRLNSPPKIQDFLNTLPFNHKKKIAKYRNVFPDGNLMPTPRTKGANRMAD
jgi:hypothetical protein